MAQPREEFTTRTAASVRAELAIALEILDNPGGGLVSGYQALGQARSHLAELDSVRFQSVIRLLDQAERQAIWRNFRPARETIREALSALDAS